MFLLFAIVLFSCDENATCIDADDFGDLEREIIEINSSDTFKCTVNPAYRDGDKYNVTTLSITDKVSPTLKECLTTTTYINAINTDAAEMRALLGADTTTNLKGCEDYLGRGFLTDPVKKDYIDYCEAFCENLCNTISSGNDASPWIANTPRKENSDIGVNITPGSKISVTIQEGIISLPEDIAIPTPTLSYSIDPHNFEPHNLSGPISIPTSARYDVTFKGDYFDSSSTANSPYVGCRIGGGCLNQNISDQDNHLKLIVK